MQSNIFTTISLIFPNPSEVYLSQDFVFLINIHAFLHQVMFLIKNMLLCILRMKKFCSCVTFCNK